MADGISDAIGTGLGAVVSLSLLGKFVEGVGEPGDTIVGEKSLLRDLETIDID